LTFSDADGGGVHLLEDVKAAGEQIASDRDGGDVTAAAAGTLG
jgi:hypothetical protein